MTDYEPIDLGRDAAHLKNELMEVGRLAGTYVSRAAEQYVQGDPITLVFDHCAQRLTLLYLQLQDDLDRLDKK